MAVEHEQVGVIATVILAVIVGAIGTIIYLIFLKPCTDIKEEDSDKKGSKNLTKKHDEGIPKKRPNSTSSSSSSSSKRKVAKDSNSVTTHGLLLTSLKGHTGTVTSIDFSSNGKYLASCSEDRTARLWNLKDISAKDHKYTRVNIEFDHASSISVSPDSRAFIVSLAKERILRVYKVTKKKEDGGGASLLVVQDVDFPNAHNAEIINIGISNNGKFIMSADKGTHIIIWSLKGEVYDKIDTLLVYNTLAQISPCGNLVAACGFTSDVKLWHIAFSKNNEFQQITKGLELKGHTAGVLSFSFSNDSKRIATVSKDKTWKVWDIDVNYLKGQDSYLLHTGHFATATFDTSVHIALSHDYFTVALSLGRSILLYNTNQEKLEEVIENIHQSEITALAWYSDSRQLFSAGGADRSIKVWHNPVGVRASVADLKEKLLKAKSDAMKKVPAEIRVNGTVK